MDDQMKMVFLLFNSICSWQFHPGVKARLSPVECMVETHRYWRAFVTCMNSEDLSWVRGSVQQSERERV